MDIIEGQAFARAGLIGNPSDGYQGKTISIIVRNFRARVVLYDWEDVELLLSQEDHSRFKSVRELVRDVELHGYYGGIRLVKATIKRFVEYCDQQGHMLHDGNFSVRYESNIPRQVGLAGSSAIIVATLRALMTFYQVEIPQRVQPSLVLSVEQQELGITAGLQDRVIQIYEGAVFMDFTEAATDEVNGFTCGTYEPIAPSSLPSLYIAYSTDFSEPTETFHNNLRHRYDSGESLVVSAMTEIADLAGLAREGILAGNADAVAALMDRNFDLRQSMCKLPRNHVEMIERARSVGVSAKFAGSGGAIIGTFTGDAMLEALKVTLADIGCRVIIPVLV